MKKKKVFYGWSGIGLTIIMFGILITIIVSVVISSTQVSAEEQRAYEEERMSLAHDVRLFGLSIGRAKVIGRETRSFMRSFLDRGESYWLSVILEESGESLDIEVTHTQYEWIKDESLLIFYEGYEMGASLEHRSWFMDVYLTDGRRFRGYVDVTAIGEDWNFELEFGGFDHYVPLLRDPFEIGRVIVWPEEE